MSGPGRRLHPAVRGFDRAAEAYERARPGYPAAAVDRLARALRLGPRRTVVELASGTGKFTRALASVGCAIVAVEPIEGMRAVFARVAPDVAVVPGTAESIPLPDGFADAVVVAQAFHWFRPRPALAEIARVLAPGGGLGLVWNTRDDSVPFSRRLTELTERYRRATPRARERAWRAAFERSGGPFGPLRHRRYRHVQRLDAATAVDRVLSISYVARLPGRMRARVAREVRHVLASEASTRDRRSIELPYRTDVYWTYRR